jgi:hypothetical protein
MTGRMLAAVLIALVVSAGHAFAWGYQGHELTGSIADHLLGTHAKREVAKILGFDLRTAGPWADCARSVARLPDGTFKYAPSKPEFRIPCPSFETPSETARMEDYVSRNWHNCTYEPKHGCDEAYHFTDVAIQQDAYKLGLVGTSDHDLISAINAAILVLKDQPAPWPFSIRDKKEALFLLAHFVGDLHQPLHVGAIYLDNNGAPVNPDAGTFDPATQTAGGNLITDGDKNLHGEWDAIPADLGESASADMIAKARAVAPTGGRVEEFTVAWATDSLLVSHEAFAGLTFTRSGTTKWQVHFNDQAAYLANQDRIKREQLAKGGARLAQLLNAIWPSPAPSAEKVTACTTTNVCYCITAANRDAIAANVARVRQLLADQRAQGKATGYLSIPLSTAGGGYMGVNREIAQQTKDRIERRFGSAWAWVLNPGAEGSGLPDDASGADFMYMWTQILEGRGGLGEDFDFFYFAGPTDFARFFSLTGTGDAERVAAYFDQRVATDPGLMSAVEARKLSKAGFRKYYSLRASVTFSNGSHDEWNIVKLLNDRRRASDEFGVHNQIAVMFDGNAIPPGTYEEAAASGYVGQCRN